MVTVPRGIQNPAYRRSRPTFCIPKTASFGRQIDVADSDLAAARCLADSIRTCRGNSKSMANLLCAYAVPDDARARTVSTQCSADGRVRHVAAAASAHQQHEFPAHVTVLADAVRLGNLGEREGLRDREGEAPGLDQLADLGERVDCAAGTPLLNVTPVLLRATEVGDRHDMLGGKWSRRPSRELRATGAYREGGHTSAFW